MLESSATCDGAPHIHRKLRFKVGPVCCRLRVRRPAMAGTALLPWEEWFARLLHAITVAIRRWSHKRRYTRELARTTNWPNTEGTIQRVCPDFSYPREQIDYFYSTERGYHSGSYWHWFDGAIPGQLLVDDRIVVRYDPADHERSVFLRTIAEQNPPAIPPHLR